MSLPMPLEPTDPASMRVSHGDRDVAIEALQVAAGDGRLTGEELDERVEAALAARTYADLAPLLADLPGPGAGTLVAMGRTLAAEPVSPKELIRVKRSGGSLKYEGAWLVPKRMELDIRGGSVLLDFTGATVSGPMTEVEVHIRGGSLRLFVPEGYAVDAEEVEMRGGSVRHRSGHDALSDAPVVHRIIVTGMIAGGSVVVRPSREPRAPRRRGRLRRMLRS